MTATKSIREARRIMHDLGLPYEDQTVGNLLSSIQGIPENGRLVVACVEVGNRIAYFHGFHDWDSAAAVAGTVSRKRKVRVLSTTVLVAPKVIL